MWTHTVLVEWLAKHVRQWAERLNFATTTCEFLEQTNVCGAVLNRPEEEVVAELEQLAAQHKSQGLTAPGVHVLRRLGQQSQRLREEAKRTPKGRVLSQRTCHALCMSPSDMRRRVVCQTPWSSTRARRDCTG